MAKGKLKRKRVTTLYKIEIQGVTRYWGITFDLKRRQAQHNKGLLSDEKKQLYINCREWGVEKIELIPESHWETRVEAKRMECYLILKDHFENRELWQSVPKISDM